MSKKKRKDKEVSKLRREVEVLRAQLKSESREQKNKKTPEQRDEKTTTEPAAIDVRADLRKTAILTAVCLGLLLVLYLTQSRWLP